MSNSSLDIDGQSCRERKCQIVKKSYSKYEIILEYPATNIPFDLNAQYNKRFYIKTVRSMLRTVCYRVRIATAKPCISKFKQKKRNQFVKCHLKSSLNSVKHYFETKSSSTFLKLNIPFVKQMDSNTERYETFASSCQTWMFSVMVCV